MITVNRLATSDLLSYHTLDLAMKDRGLVLVEGVNGSGKSSIFESMLFTLFGETHKPLKADDVIREGVDHKPIKGATQGYVDLDCNGTKVEVFRYRGHKEHANRMRLFVDSNDLTMGSDKETLNRLESLLGYDFDSFCKSVVFPQGGSKFVGLTDSAQKETLDKIFHVERFSGAHARVKEQLKGLRDQLLRNLTAKAEIDNAVKEAQDDVDKRADELVKWNSQHETDVAQSEDSLRLMLASQPVVDATLQQRCEELYKELTSAKNVELSRLFAKATEAVTTQRERRSSVRTEISVLQQSLEALGPEGDVVSPPAPGTTSITLAGERNKLDAEIRRVDRELAVAEQNVKRADDVLTKFTGSCPMCGTHLDAAGEQAIIGDSRSLRDQFSQQVQMYMKAQVQLGEQLDLLDYKCQHMEAFEDQAARRGMKLKLQEFEKQLACINQGIVDCVKAQEDIQAEIDKQNAKSVEYNECREKLLADQHGVIAYQQNVTAAQQRVEELKKQTNPYRAAFEAACAKLDAKTRRGKLLAWSNVALRSDIRTKEFWETGFGNSGMKSLLYSHLIPQLNSRTNEYLKILADGRYSVRFTSQSTLASGETRDKLDCEVLLSEGGGGYRKASGGEARRIDLAALFAIGDLASLRTDTAVKLRLLDEPFDDLDGDGCEAVVRALNELVVPRVGTVLVMTHSDKLKSLIPQRIHVEKVRGVSYIKQR